MAIKSYELDLLLTIMTTQAKSILRSQGYMFPYFYIMNKGEPLNIEIKHPTVMGVDCEERDFTHGPDHIYRGVIGCKLSGEEDDRAFGPIAESIAKQYSPDAIALFISCAYNEYRKGEIPPEIYKLGAMHNDPDAIRVLHVCAFSKTNPTPVMTIIPYMHRGQVSTAPGEEAQYDITFVDYPWTAPLNKIGTKILDPYRNLRR